MTTTALVSVDLAPPADRLPAEVGHYRWELLKAPSDSHAVQPDQKTATLTTTPTKRGIYVYDRWFVGEAATQRTHHVVLTADGAVPIAHAVGPTGGTVDTAVAIDGSTSRSPEGRMLSFQWRLASRPESSAATLGSADGSASMLVPDVIADYGIELRVFDGELWSTPSRVSLVVR